MGRSIFRIIPIFLLFIFIGSASFLYALTQEEMDTEYEKSEEARKNKNPDLIKQIVEPLAEQGHAKSQTRLGALYKYGLGVPKNYTESFKWFKLAADQGDANGQFQLGDLYLKGQGVPKNITESIKWMKLSAEQGNTQAQEIVQKLKIDDLLHRKEMLENLLCQLHPQWGGYVGPKPYRFKYSCSHGFTFITDYQTPGDPNTLGDVGNCKRESPSLKFSSKAEAQKDFLHYLECMRRKVAVRKQEHQSREVQKSWKDNQY